MGGRSFAFLKNLARRKSFWWILIFTLLNIALTGQILTAHAVGGVRVILLVVLIEILFEAAFIFLILRAEKKGWGLEKQFLIAAVMLGLGFLIFMPPGMAPDDAAHFRRVYGISEGVILPRAMNETGMAGSEIPTEVDDSFLTLPREGAYEEVGRLLNLEISGETTVQFYPNTAIYNPVMYLPQVVAAGLGKLFNMPFLARAYLMEIFNYAVFVILIYFAIKLMPKFKTVILFVALNPMTLQEATSMSLDGLAIGLAIFLVSYVCYLSYDFKKVMNWKQLAALYILAVLIGLCKMVYAPLVLLFFLIPYQRFGSKKRKWIHAGVMAGLFIIVNVSWLLLTSGLLEGFNFKPGANINAGEQAMVILKSPLGYLKTMFVTTMNGLPAWLIGIFGTSLGAFSFNLPILYFYLAFGILVVLFSQRDEILKISRRDRIMFSVVFFIIIMLIYLSEYLQWSDVGASTVDGIQGRYFLPILIFIPLICGRKNDATPHMSLVTKNTVLYFNMFMNIIACVVFFASNA